MSSSSTTFILDFGSQTIRAGWSDSATPSIELETGLLDAPTPKISSIAVSGRDLLLPLPAGPVRPRAVPLVRRGILTDPKAIDLVSEMAAAKGGRALVLVPVSLSETHRHELAGRAMELGFEAVAFARAPTASLFGAGELTGLSVEVGHGLAQTSAVVDGYLIEKGAAWRELAGLDVSKALTRILRKAGLLCRPGGEEKVVRAVKESACSVRTKTEPARPLRVSMPDGEELLLAEERLDAAEVLFSRQGGLQKLAFDALQDAEKDLAAVLQKNVRVFGGCSNLPGFTERFANELKGLMHPNSPLEVVSLNDKKNNSAWIGGTALAQLDSMKSFWVTPAELYEQGDRILFKRIV